MTFYDVQFQNEQDCTIFYLIQKYGDVPVVEMYEMRKGKLFLLFNSRSVRQVMQTGASKGILDPVNRVKYHHYLYGGL